MKTSLSAVLILALALGGCGANAPADPATPAAVTPKPGTTAVSVPAPASASVPAAATGEPSKGAGAASPSPVAALPRPTSVPALPIPAQEVLRLSQTAVGESVVLAYVESIKEPFALNADQIIYMADLGMTPPVIAALVKKGSASGTAFALAPVATTAPLAPKAEPPAPVGAAEPEPAPAGAPSPGLPATNAAPVATTSLAGLPVPGAPTQAPAPPVYGPAQPGATMAAPPPAALAAPVVVTAPPQAMTYATFHDTLAPYGTWVLVEPYGWCWQPAVVSVTPTWQPYCDGGSWLWTDYGWYWRSTYTWGWAPFHYGRWHRSARLGWVWAPGYDWGPAWVSWRYSDAYCGWAPLPPECRWSAGVGFSWMSGGVGVSIGFGIFDDCWYACSWNRFRDPHLSRWRLDRPRANQFVRDSNIAVGGDRSINVAGNNNTVIVNNGLPIDRVQRHSREEVRKVAVADAASPEAAQRAMRGSSSARPEIAAYRPRITPEGDRAPAPPESVLRGQESRKGPGITAASLPTRPAGNIASSMPNAVAPVPGILGATAPAGSRPAPLRSPVGSALATTPAPSAGLVPASSGVVPSRPPAGGAAATQGPSVTPSRPSRAEPAPAPARPSMTPGTTTPGGPAPSVPARPAPVRPGPSSYPGANVGVAGRPAPTVNSMPPAGGGPASPPSFNSAPSRNVGVPSPGNAAPQRPVPGASLGGPRDVPSRYPGASFAAPASPTPPSQPNPSFNAPVARPGYPAPRPEPRAMAPSPMPGASFASPPARPAAPVYTPPIQAVPSTRSMAPAPVPQGAPAPSFRPEPARPAPGRGGPAER